MGGLVNAREGKGRVVNHLHNQTPICLRPTLDHLPWQWPTKPQILRSIPIGEVLALSVLESLSILKVSDMTTKRFSWTTASNTVQYLEDKYPQSPLLPSDPHKRAINFQAATVVSSGIQPFQNFFGLMDFVEPLKKILGGKLSPEQGRQLVIYHIKKGFAALEDILKGHAEKYATGDEVSLADVFLAPQIDAAIRRFSAMDEFPLLKRLNEAYNQLPAFVDAIPTNQPDAPENLK